MAIAKVLTAEGGHLWDNMRSWHPFYKFVTLPSAFSFNDYDVYRGSFTWVDGRATGTIESAYFPDNVSITDINVSISDLDVMHDRNLIPRIMQFDDVISGNSGNDTIGGYAGNDIIRGGGGNDELFGWAGSDKIYGGDGHDSIVGHGDLAPDDPANRDVLYGDGGSDRIGGGAGNDRLYGGAGDDRQSAPESAVTGGAGLSGGGGDDMLDGGTGADDMMGGEGNDTYYVDNVNDQVYDSILQGTRDIVYASVSWTVPIHQQVEFVKAVAGIARINLTGNDEYDNLTGNDRHNILSGMGGNDRLTGGEGRDILVGGFGSDVLIGGYGSDTFRFDSVQDSAVGVSRDTVKLVGVLGDDGDRIDLRGIDAVYDVHGINQAFHWVSRSNLGAAFTDTAGELRFARGLLQGDVNGDGTADFEVKISGALHVSDVIL